MASATNRPAAAHKPPQWLRSALSLPDPEAEQEELNAATSDARFDLASYLTLANQQNEQRNSPHQPLPETTTTEAAPADGGGGGDENDDAELSERDALLKYLARSSSDLSPPVAEAVPISDIEQLFHRFDAHQEVNPLVLLSEADEEFTEATSILCFALGRDAARALSSEIMDSPQRHVLDRRPGIRICARAALRLKLVKDLVGNGANGWGCHGSAPCSSASDDVSDADNSGVVPCVVRDTGSSTRAAASEEEERRSE